MDQNQQDVASPASNSMADFNNDRANNQVERRQLAHVPDIDEILATFQNHQGDGPPAFNRTAVFNNARANNQPKRWQPIRVSGANETMVQTPNPRAFNRTGRGQLFHEPDANRNIRAIRNAVNHNVRYITPTRSTPSRALVQIRHVPVISITPLLGNRTVNNQGQPSFRDPFQSSNVVLVGNSTACHGTTSPRLINSRRNQNDVYQFQARRGNSETPRLPNLDRYPRLTVYKCSPTINNIANSSSINENSAFVPPGQYNSNSSSSRLNINQNSNNEVNQQVSLNCPENIANKVEEVSKDTPKFVWLPWNESTTPKATNIKVCSGTRPRRPRKQDFKFTRIDPATNNVESYEIPIIEEASSLQSDISTSKQNEPLNQSPAEKRKLQMEHKENIIKRQKQNYTPVIKESSTHLITKGISRNAANTTSYIENSQDSRGTSDDYSMNLKDEANPDLPKDIITRSYLNPSNVKRVLSKI